MASKKNATGSDGAFGGFSEEAFQFLKKLGKNNDRDWFVPRKALFEELVQAPMMQLVLAIESEAKKNKMPLATKAKGVLSRIYRDVRFSADKRPYHTFLSGTLHKNGKKDAPGALYVHVGEKEHFAAAGFWQPDRPMLTKWRLKMQDEPGEFLAMVKRLKNKKLVLSAEHRLQRMPRGFEAAEGSAIAEFLRYQSFVVSKEITRAETMSANLPSVVAQFAMDAKPLLDYGWTVPGAKPTVFLD